MATVGLSLKAGHLTRSKDLALLLLKYGRSDAGLQRTSIRGKGNASSDWRRRKRQAFCSPQALGAASPDLIWFYQFSLLNNTEIRAAVKCQTAYATTPLSAYFMQVQIYCVDIFIGWLQNEPMSLMKTVRLAALVLTACLVNAEDTCSVDSRLFVCMGNCCMSCEGIICGSAFCSYCVTACKSMAGSVETNCFN